MKELIFILEKCNAEDIRKIEKAFGLNAFTIDTTEQPKRVSEMRDYFIEIGFYDHSIKRQ